MKNIEVNFKKMSSKFDVLDDSLCQTEKDVIEMLDQVNAYDLFLRKKLRSVWNLDRKLKKIKREISKVRQDVVFAKTSGDYAALSTLAKRNEELGVAVENLVPDFLKVISQLERAVLRDQFERNNRSSKPNVQGFSGIEKGKPTWGYDFDVDEDFSHKRILSPVLFTDNDVIVGDPGEVVLSKDELEEIRSDVQKENFNEAMDKLGSAQDEGSGDDSIVSR